MMKCFNIIKADRVVCDEVLTVCDIEKGIPIRTTLTPRSRFDLERSEVRVFVSNCRLKIDQENERFSIDLELLISKDLIIIQDNGPDIPIKLSFGKCFPGQEVTQCRPCDLPPELLRRLRCQIYDVIAEETLELNLETNTFDETLCVTVTVKIVFEDQIRLPEPGPPEPPGPCPPCPSPPVHWKPCPFPPQPLPPMPLVIPVKVINAVELAAGKIRSQIGNPIFKEELLMEIDRIKDLLLAGRILEALAIITAIKEEVQLKINIFPAKRISLNLVFGDLVAAEKQIINLIEI